MMTTFVVYTSDAPPDCYAPSLKRRGGDGAALSEEVPSFSQGEVKRFNEGANTMDTAMEKMVVDSDSGENIFIYLFVCLFVFPPPYRLIKGISQLISSMCFVFFLPSFSVSRSVFVSNLSLSLSDPVQQLRSALGTFGSITGIKLGGKEEKSTWESSNHRRQLSGFADVMFHDEESAKEALKHDRMPLDGPPSPGPLLA
uniref:RRM domain-containing protein n=1 Tax=Eptatretus burgeri TaxID=7764 RepID=A0A8C4QFQ2_EPTBU